MSRFRYIIFSLINKIQMQSTTYFFVKNVLLQIFIHFSNSNMNKFRRAYIPLKLNINSQLSNIFELN